MSEQEKPTPDQMGLENEAAEGLSVESALSGAGFEEKGEAEHPIKYPNTTLWESGDRKIYVSPAVEKPGVTVIWDEKKPLAFVSENGSIEIPGSDEAGSIEDLKGILAT